MIKNEAGLELHEECRARLIKRLSEDLPVQRLRHNSYLDWDSTTSLSGLDEALPSEIRKQVSSWISEQPLFTFVVERIQDAISHREWELEPSVSLLSETPEFADVIRAASDLIDEFQTLPFSYHSFAALPYDVSRHLAQLLEDDSLYLGSGISLVTPTDDFRSLYPEPRAFIVSSRWGGLGNEVVDWSDSIVYLRQSIDGFAGPTLTTETVRKCQRVLRAFCGVCLAHRLIEIGGGMFVGPRLSRILFFRRLPSGFVYSSAHASSEELTTRLDQLRVHKFFEEIEQDEVRYSLLRDLVLGATALFREDINEPTQDRLQRACSWYFESRCVRDELMSYLMAMIALEILLGDKAVSDLIGVGELLANRCAYLIGHTHSQRMETLKDFRRLYETRSAIVHRGKDKLSEAEREDLWTLRWTVDRVIQEEVKLLLSESKTSTET